jgi:hypothetical protein
MDKDTSSLDSDELVTVRHAVITPYINYAGHSEANISQTI